VCSYAQGYNIIRAKSEERGWGVDLAALGRIWKGGCIIRAKFLDRIKLAYSANPELPSLLVDPSFAKDLADRRVLRAGRAGQGGAAQRVCVRACWCVRAWAACLLPGGRRQGSVWTLVPKNHGEWGWRLPAAPSPGPELTHPLAVPQPLPTRAGRPPGGASSL
jgi:hypothetical protein